MFFRNNDGYAGALHKIYLNAERNPSVSVELEINRLADDDYELADELKTTYKERYGYYGFRSDQTHKTGFVYFLKAEGFYGFVSPVFGRYKIGLSNNPQRRLVELNGQQAPCPIVMLRAIQVDDMHKVEGELHQKFKRNRKHGEWFDFWFWEKPLVHLQYNGYQHNFKKNKLARGHNLKPIATGVALFAGLAIASAMFVSSIMPSNGTLDTEPSQEIPVKVTNKTQKARFGE